MQVQTPHEIEVIKGGKFSDHNISTFNFSVRETFSQDLVLLCK